MFETIFIISVVILFVTLSFLFFYKRGFFSKSKNLEMNGELIRNKVDKVFKVILAEGFFSEIVNFTDKGKKLFGLVTSTKKSLIIVDAKVLVGFDSKKVIFEVDSKSKKIKFLALPEPEILSMETDFKFYDINNGIFNKFSSEDYTEVLKVGKEHIKNKVNDSELMEAARAQLKLVLTQVVQTTGMQIEAGKNSKFLE